MKLDIPRWVCRNERERKALRDWTLEAYCEFWDRAQWGPLLESLNGDEEEAARRELKARRLRAVLSKGSPRAAATDAGWLGRPGRKKGDKRPNDLSLKQKFALQDAVLMYDIVKALWKYFFKGKWSRRQRPTLSLTVS
jgi:hypothetical protein